VAESLVLLTQLPVPPGGEPRGAAAAWAWPVAGAAVGLIAAASAALALALGLPATVAAAVALAAQALVTGGLHEDGLADSADGLWGGPTRERRLEIMKDSRIGSYGALALGLTLLLRWSALAAMLANGPAWGALLAVAALSRWPMAWLLAALPPAREGGLARFVGRPAAATLALGAGMALALAILGGGAAGLAAALAVLGTALAWTGFVRARLGGQTGDTCGAAQQLSEIAALLVFTSAL
jgi:adenosylcobinamide-GDP ribazoletransferase